MKSEKGQSREGVFQQGRGPGGGGGGVSITNGRYEGSEVVVGVDKLLGKNRLTDDENGTSVSMRGNVWNTCRMLEGGGLLGGELVTNFVSMYRSKPGVKDLQAGLCLV